MVVVVAGPSLTKIALTKARLLKQRVSARRQEAKSGPNSLKVFGFLTQLRYAAAQLLRGILLLLVLLLNDWARQFQTLVNGISRPPCRSAE